MSEIGLGRRTPPDRSSDMEHLLPHRSLSWGASYRFWSSGGVLDQDGTSQCVAYAGYKYLTSGPVLNRHPAQTPEAIYRECLKVDEWPGEDFDGGTSVRALFKVFQVLGYVDAYSWAFDVESVVAHLISKGPVVMGTNWYTNMFMPHNRTGYLEVSGNLDGGHSYMLCGCDKKRHNPDRTTGAVRMVNSWGVKWGQRGRAWITFKDLDRLIKEDGEACVANEIKISALESMEEVA